MTNLPIPTRAAVPVGIRPILDGPLRAGTVLGAHPSAIYLRFGDDVVAVLSADAVAVPCGVVVPTSRLPCVDLEPVSIGAGELRVGSLRVRAGRFVDRRVPRLAEPSRAAIERARDQIDALGFREHPGLTVLDESVAGGLIGRGSGLTPSGDDVVAGYLVAAHAWGQPAGPVREFVRDHARHRTTSLSAVLLRHAADGEAIPALAEFLAALTGDDARRLDAASARLLAVGHTSGVALATGALLATRIPVAA